ncbi:MAG TPA: hypothetical protein DEA51_05985 [Erysipelotrichaceae bacterium]|nr:hypothetical protein [Erysipelotrichaceae bacterium]
MKMIYMEVSHMKMLVDYLKSNIDDDLMIAPWQNQVALPMYLKENYVFYNMFILGRSCVLLEVIADMSSIEQIQKHIKVVENLTDFPVVFMFKTLTRYRRKSLIANRIAFVIEDGQMYLPFLGVDLKKTSEYKNEVKSFTTPTQMVYLYFLYHEDVQLNTTEIAEKLDINLMTASRALNDLYHANLIDFEVGGRTKRSKMYKRIKDPDYFRRGSEYLKSPIRSIFYIEDKPQMSYVAGLDALARLSRINPSQHPVIAVGKDQLEEYKMKFVKNMDLVKDKKLIEVEIWDYSPGLFSIQGFVDKLSLYLSLKENKDERVEQALEEVLQGESWYMD